MSRYGRVVHLQLGRHGFDVATRGLVVAAVSPKDLTRSAEPVSVRDLIAQGPAMIEIRSAGGAPVEAAVARLGELFSGPIGARTARADIAHQAVLAGASFVHDPDGLADPAYLRVIEAVNVALVISAPTNVSNERSFLIERGRWAEAAGVSRDRLVLAAVSDTARSLHELGYTTMVESPPDPSAQGVHVLAMSNGVRIISSNQVRATRRTIDTVSELLERRETAGAL